MANPTRIRTIEFLPEIFQTETNRQFLAATLDQLVSQPNFDIRQGYIGSRVGLGINSVATSYVVEPDKARADYQLEPAVVFLDPDTDVAKDMITYPGMIDALTNSSAFTNNHQRLWQNQYYSWDPLTNLDPFVNFTQYYWLPYGPDPVTVSTSDVFTRANYTVSNEVIAYSISGFDIINPTITLVRGGIYTFTVNQNSAFWIQGTAGTNAIVNNENTRDVLGVSNNGTDRGVVTFEVPAIDAQDVYYNLVDNEDSADLVTTLSFNDFVQAATARFSLVIQGNVATVTMYDSSTAVIQDGSELFGFDTSAGVSIVPGTQLEYITDPLDPNYAMAGSGGNGKYLVSIAQNVTVAEAAAVYYEAKSLFSIGGNIDGVTALNGKTLVIYNDLDPDHNGKLYRITIIPGLTENYDVSAFSDEAEDTGLYDQYAAISLEYIKTFDVDTKITITSGNQYAGRSFYRDSQRQNLLTLVPYLTARSNTLYYQDGTIDSSSGIIKIIDSNSSDKINVDRDILGQTRYQSPNGVLFTNGLKVTFDDTVEPESYVGNQYYVAGVGESIQLVPVLEMVAYETYSETVYIPWDTTYQWDEAPWDVRLYVPLHPDYITIARESRDRNPWSRSNRWFHADVLEKTALYNNTVSGAKGIDLNAARAQRPIIEFKPNLKLFASGAKALVPVDYVDTTVTEAATQVSGPTYIEVTSVSSVTNALTLATGINSRFTRGTPVEFTGTPLGQAYYRIQSVSDEYRSPARLSLTQAAVSMQQGAQINLDFLRSPPAITANIMNISSAAVGIITVSNQQPQAMVDGDRIYISGVVAMNRLPSAPSSYLPSINNNQYFDSTPYFVKFSSNNLDGSTSYELYLDSALTVGLNTTYYSAYLANTGGKTYAIFRGTWPELNSRTFYVSFYLNTGLTAQLTGNPREITVNTDVTGIIPAGVSISSTPNQTGARTVLNVEFDAGVSTITLDSDLVYTEDFIVHVNDGARSQIELYSREDSPGIISSGSGLDARTFGEYIPSSGIIRYGNFGLEVNTQYFIDAVLDTTHITIMDQAGQSVTIPVTQDIEEFAGATPTRSNTISYSPDPNPNNLTDSGYVAIPGSRVIFAAEKDENIRNKVWQINYIYDNQRRPSIILEQVDVVTEDSQTIVKSGYSHAGETWYYSGSDWLQGQSKFNTNQPPLFDVYDRSGFSFSDQRVYPNTTFTGSKLFSYATGSGVPDTVLGFPLKYQTVGSIGDIVFDVDLNSDLFEYSSGVTTVSDKINSGYIHQYTSELAFQRLTGWVTTAAPSFQPQIFEFIRSADNTDQVFVCDIPAISELEYNWQTVQVFVNNKYLTRYPVGVEQIPANANYVFEIFENGTVITINEPLDPGTPVQIYIVSAAASDTAYYKVPTNLENNPLNANPETISLGEVKGQYASIVQNYVGVATVAGYVFGNNNFRDLGDLTVYGSKIIQSSSSLVLPAAFLREKNYDILDSIQFNAQEYEKFKSLLISTVDNGGYQDYATPPQILDFALDQIARTRNSENAFFWSDMVVNRSPFITNTYSVNLTRADSIYGLSRIYDYSSANYYGVAVYLTYDYNGDTYTQQLVKDQDYTISDNSPSLVISRVLNVGEIVTINEYNQTYGSYVPNTPTKLGLYPKFTPQVIVDNTYLVPTAFLQGHDGSYSKLYGEIIDGQLTDARDQVLYEFELRIYNNLKISSPVPIIRETVWPGEFRTTDYQWEEIKSMYSVPVLNYFGQNKIDYTDQLYADANPFTYNYRSSQDKLSFTELQQGFWRGVYIWLYDTDTPNLTPWKMLGIDQEPVWWSDRYGDAPYTSDNLLLWGDLALGKIWNGSEENSIIDIRFARPNLTSCLPVGDSGELVPPLRSIVLDYDSNKFQRSWSVGDDGPAESAYLKSSTWPFDLQRLLILTKPAQWFSLMADRDKYKYNQEFNQYLYDDRYHLSPSMLEVYGNGTAKHSYINWIVDYQLQFGEPGTTNVEVLLKNLDVRLAYRMAGFSSNVLADFIVDKTTASGVANLRIPDNDYDLLLYKNQPYDTITYSAVIVQKTAKGWTVYGNSQQIAYFSTVTPKIDGQYITIADSVTVTANYYDIEMRVPYGQVFTSIDQVCQFMVDYGRYLEIQGIKFSQDDQANAVDWTLAAREFVIWARTGWSVGSTANFNPAYAQLTVDTEDGVVQPLTIGRSNFILNQNLLPIAPDSMRINREGTKFVANVISESDTIAYSKLSVSSYEHAVVFKNNTSFGDLIYYPITGLRQPRLYMEARISAEWRGVVDAQGFIFNSDNIAQWDPNKFYTKGTLVAYKDQYWAANDNIQPSAVFQTSQWIRSDYGKIAKGILANPSTRALDSTVFYNTNTATLISDADELGFSLIGFRPRTYLSQANFDLISQVNIYKNMIREKGTNAIAEAFKNTNFTQGSVDYDIYENWAIKTGEYGGILAENYVEAILDKAALSNNPNVIKFVNDLNEEDSSVAQQVRVADLWDYGQPVTAPNVMPILTQSASEKVLTAGYVSFDDVKYAAYNKLDLNLNPPVLTDLYRNNYVWVANDNATWQVYTVESIGAAVISARNNYDGTSTVVFSERHGLLDNDFISISNFYQDFDGFYLVSSVPTLTEIIINTPDLDASVREIQAVGVGLVMRSQRVATANQALSLNLLNTEFNNSLLWVDDYNQTGWALLAKDINYTKANVITSDNSQEFGKSMAYSPEIGFLIADTLTGEISRFDQEFSLIEKFTPGVGTTNKILASGDTAIFLQANLGQLVVYPFRDGAESVTIQGTSGFATNGALSGDGRYLFVNSSAEQTITVYLIDNTGQYQAIQQIELPNQDNIISGAWAATMSTNYDGSVLFIGDANATIGESSRAGVIYVFARGSVVGIASEYALIQVITAAEIQSGSQLSLGMSNNLWGSEMAAGAPGFVTDIFTSKGIVNRYTNTAKRFGQVVSGIFQSGETITGTIIINGIAVSVAQATTQQAVSAILNSGLSNITAAVIALDDGSTQIAIEVINKSTEPQDNLLNVLGSQTSLNAWRIQVYTNTQTILEPHQQVNSRFGTVLVFDEHDSLVVTAPSATSYSATTFDFLNDRSDNDTIFDQDTTGFIDDFQNTGAAYIFDYLPESSSVSGPGSYVYAQSINNITNSSSYGDSSVVFYDFKVLINQSNSVQPFVNSAMISDWHVIKQSLPIVDIANLDGVNIFDRDTNDTQGYLDYIDPILGKFLAAAQTNIDYISTQDPAGYTITDNQSNALAVWGLEQVGKIWFDISQVRYIDTHQPDLAYDARFWGSAFPGSLANIWVWTKQTTPPDLYNGSGEIKNTTDYVVAQDLDSRGDAVPAYYYWVKNDGIVYSDAGKTLTSQAIASYVTNPRASGVSFMAPISNDALSLYNVNDLLSVDTPTLHIEWDTGSSADAMHEQFQLIREGVEQDYLVGFPSLRDPIPSKLYQKYVSSLSGIQPNGFVLDSITVTEGGANYTSVPDVLVVPSVGDKTAPASDDPRAAQAVAQISDGAVIDVVFTGGTVTGYSILPTITFVGGGGAGAKAVINTELSYRSVPDTSLTPPKRYGVSFAPNQTMFLDRLEAIKNYSEFANRIFRLFPISVIRNPLYLNVSGVSYIDGVRTNFDTAEYWQYANWWVEGYSDITKITAEVNGVFQLETLTLNDGEVARVKNSSGARSEFYVYENGEFSRVGLENGTIVISSELWSENSSELASYWIVRAINEQIFTGDLLKYRNENLILMFKYAQTEAMDSQNFLPWLNKTSFIDVSSKVRDLLPYVSYQSDNSAFLQGYLNEVKPFHVSIKSFGYRYTGQDNYFGYLTDFDLPAQYQRAINTFVSPQLVYSEAQVNEFKFLPSSSVWQSTEYSNWYSAYGLSIAPDSTEYTKVSTLASYINNVDNYLYLSSAYSLNDQGVLLVDNEYIGYTSVDRFRNRVLGLQRGFFDSDPAEHYPGAIVSTRQLGITIIDSARGYREPPLITLELDTSIYPDETQARIRQPILQPQIINPGINGKLILVNIIDGGAGYPAQPRLVIESSTISSVFSSQNVFSVDTTSNTDARINTIRIDPNTFRTGDPVRITAATDYNLPAGLVSGQTYYLGKPLTVRLGENSVIQQLDIDVEDYLAFYVNKQDSLIDRNRIVLRNQGTGNGHQVAVTAIAAVNMTGMLVRQLRSSLKYDRVSYQSIIQPWRAGNRYPGAERGGFLDKASSSQPSSLGETENSLLERPNYVSNQFLASNSDSIILDITSVILSNPVVIITAEIVQANNGELVTVREIQGTTQLNENNYYVRVIGERSLQLYLDQDLTQALDGRAFSPYVSGGILVIAVDSVISEAASLVLYEGTVWRCQISNSDEYFDVNKWSVVSSSDPELTALDRIAGWYTPTATQPAKATQLVSGIEYPEATYLGQTFTGTYTLDVNLASVNNTTANMNYYDVSGGRFTDGYAPEELVAGVVQDNLLLNVTARPGAAWLERQVQGVTVTSVAIANGGTGYTSGEIIRFIPKPIAPGNLTAVINSVDANTGAITSVTLGDTDDAIFTVAPSAVVTGGAAANVVLGLEGTVDKITINAGGFNYSNATVTVAAPFRGRTAQAAVGSYANGSIASITVVDGGTGYTSAPLVTITDNGNGTGATATSQLFLGTTVPSDQVYKLVITSLGDGYLTGDPITFNTPNITLSTAEAVAVSSTVKVANNSGVSSGMTVTAAGITDTVRVASVPDYTTIVLDSAISLSANANITFTGTAAAATVIADPFGTVVDAFITNSGSGYSLDQLSVTPVASFISTTGSNANITVNSRTNYIGYTGFGLQDVEVDLVPSTDPLVADTFSFQVENASPATVIVYLRSPIRDSFGNLSYTARRLYVQQDYTIDWGNKTVTLTASGLAQLALRAGQTIMAQISEIGGGNHLVDTDSDQTPFLTVPDLVVGAVTQLRLPVPYVYLLAPQAGVTVPTTTFLYPPSQTGNSGVEYNKAWSAPIITQDGTPMLYYSLANSAGDTSVINVVDEGFGYEPTNPPQVTIGVPGQASAITTITSGSVVALTLVRWGYGYDYLNPPSVTIFGDGAGATASADVIAPGQANEGSIILTLGSTGSGYTFATVIIDPPQFQGIPTTARANVTPAGSIDYVEILNPGLGYYPDPNPDAVLGGYVAGTISISPPTGIGGRQAVIEFDNLRVAYSDFQLLADPVNPNSTLVRFTRELDVDQHYYNVVLLGAKTNSRALSWSLPETQLFSVSNPNQLNYPLSNYAGGTNPNNAVVEINGQRLIPGSFSLNYETISNQDQVGYPAPVLLADVSTFTDSIFFNYNSTDVIILVGTNGSIIKTTAYPWVWTDRITDTGLDLRAVAVASDASIIIAVGDQSLILASYDQGETWNKQSAPLSTQLNGVAWDENNSQFVIVGDQGIVFTGNGFGAWAQNSVDVFGWGGPEPAIIAIDLADTGGNVLDVIFTADTAGNIFRGKGYRHLPTVTVEDPVNGYTDSLGVYHPYSSGSGATVSVTIGEREYNAKFSADINDSLLSNVNVYANSATALAVGEAIGGFTATEFTANIYNNQLAITGDISGNLLTVNTVSSGNVVVGSNLFTALSSVNQFSGSVTGNELSVTQVQRGQVAVGNVTFSDRDSTFLSNVLTQQSFSLPNSSVAGNIITITSGTPLANSTIYANGITRGSRIISGFANAWQIDKSLPSFFGSLYSNGVLEVSSIDFGGSITVGSVIDGAGVLANTTVTANTGGIGLYTVNNPPTTDLLSINMNVIALNNIDIVGYLDAPAGNAFVPGIANGTGVYNIDTAANTSLSATFTQSVLTQTRITDRVTGTGGTGTYLVNLEQQTAANIAMTANITVMNVSNVTDDTDFGAIRTGTVITANTLGIIPFNTIVLNQNLGNTPGNLGYDGEYILSQPVISNATALVVSGSYADPVIPGTLLLSNLGNNTWRIGTAEFTGSITGNTLAVTDIRLGTINVGYQVSGNTVAANTVILSQKTFTASNVTVVLDIASWPIGDLVGEPEVGMLVYGLGFGSATRIAEVYDFTRIRLDNSRGISFTGYITVDPLTPIINQATLTVTDITSGAIIKDMEIDATNATVPAGTKIVLFEPGATGGIGNYRVTYPVTGTDIGGPMDLINFQPTPFTVNGIAGVLGGIGSYIVSQSQTVASDTLYLNQAQQLAANTSITLGQKDPEYSAITSVTVDTAGSGYTSGARLKFTPDSRDFFTIPPRTSVIVSSRPLSNSAVIVNGGQDYDSNAANVYTTIETSKVITVSDFTSNAIGTGAVLSIAIGETSYSLAHDAPNFGAIFFGGVNFVTGEQITVPGYLLGGANTTNDAVLTVGNVSGNTLGTAAGAILDFTSITGVPAANVGGDRATANVVVTLGEISAVTISDPGSGYTSPAVTTVTGANNALTGTQINQAWDVDIWDRITPDLTAVEVGNGSVVTVGDNGQVFFRDSADIESWQEANTGIVDPLHRVRWNANVGNAATDRWIAVGAGGTIITATTDVSQWTDISTTIAGISVISIDMYNDTTPALVTLSDSSVVTNGDAVYMFNIVPNNNDTFNVTGVASALTGTVFYAGNVDTVANTIQLYTTPVLVNAVSLETLGYSNKQQIASISGNGTHVSIEFSSIVTGAPPFFIGQRVYIDGTTLPAFNTGPYSIVDYYNNDPRLGLIVESSTIGSGSGGEVKINFTINPLPGAILSGGTVTTTTADLYDIRYAENTYAAVGADGTIITNSGNTLPSVWTTETSGTTKDLLSLIYVDNTVPTVHPDWFMGSDFGSVWRTDDFEGTGSWSLTDTRSFDINKLKVFVNGVELVYNTEWQLNFFSPEFQATWDGEYAGVYGIFSSTPWDPTRLYVILNSGPTVGSIVRITYDTDSPSYVISGQNLFLRVPIQTNDDVAVTTFHDTTEQSLSTTYISGVTVSAIQTMDTFLSPVRISTPNEHNLATGQAVRLDGIDGGVVKSRANGKVFFVNVVTAQEVELYNDSLLTEPTLGVDTGPWLSGGVIWPLASYNLGQTDWVLTDTQRLWVTLNGRRIATEDLVLYRNNELGILLPVGREDDVVVTSMTPDQSPDEQSFTVKVADTIDSTYNLAVQSVRVNNIIAAGAVSSDDWTTAPTLVFSAPDLAGGRVAQAVARLGYGIASLAVSLPGENYTAPVVTISAPEFESGRTATAVARIVNSTVVGIDITDPGAGYSTVQTISATITDSTGRGCILGALTLTVTGQISAVEIIDSGWGYVRPPSLRADYLGLQQAPEFIVNVTRISGLLGEVYNSNSFSRTWLTEDINYYSSVIPVKNVLNLLELVESSGTVEQEVTDGRLFYYLINSDSYDQLTYIVVTINGQEISDQYYFIDQSGLDQAGSFVSQANPGDGRIKLILDSSVAAEDDEISVVLGFGNKARINSEIVQFEKIDPVNNLLIDVKRGVDRTAVQQSAEKGTFVQSISEWNKLPEFYYTDSWADREGGPLQTSDSPAGLFLKQ